jgi:hypothetical protein
MHAVLRIPISTWNGLIPLIIAPATRAARAKTIPTRMTYSPRH